MKPPEYKQEYTYRIETSGCDSSERTEQKEAAVISDLPPGTNCTFCVSVRAEDDTAGEANCISQYISKTLNSSFLKVFFLYCHFESFLVPT